LLPKELTHNLAWSGDDRRREFMWVQQQRQALMVDGAQMSIARDQDGTGEQRCLGQDARVVDLELRQQTAVAKFAGKSLGLSRVKWRFEQRTEATLPPKLLHGLLSAAANALGLAKITQISQLVENAGRHQAVRMRQSLDKCVEGIQHFLHLVGEVEEDVGVNGQAQGLRDRKAVQPRDDANGGARPLTVCSWRAGVSPRREFRVFSFPLPVLQTSLLPYPTAGLGCQITVEEALADVQNVKITWDGRFLAAAITATPFRSQLDLTIEFHQSLHHRSLLVFSRTRYRIEHKRSK